VNPNGALTSYRFEFGTTPAYGSSTLVRILPSVNPPMVEVVEPGVFVTAGTTYHFRLVAWNSGGEVRSPDQTFTTVLSSYQQWIVNAFGSLTAAGSGPSDDSDGDSVPNLVEYAFGGNATAAGPLSGLPVFSFWESPESGITFPSIVYRPDPSRTEVTITPVASNNLNTWTTNGIVVTNLPDGSRRAVAQGIQHYMRLQITSP
jgi:hypothetical protein